MTVGLCITCAVLGIVVGLFLNVGPWRSWRTWLQFRDRSGRLWVQVPDETEGEK